MIIKNDPIRNVSWEDQNDELLSWYAGLDDEVKAIVQPVTNVFTTGEVSDGNVTFDIPRWIPNNLYGEVAADVTSVVQGTNGSPRAFALSLADVTRLSGAGRGFPLLRQRGSVALGWWWLRTPSTSTQAWITHTNGHLGGTTNSGEGSGAGGVRPALIIHQSPN
ncbi:DUF6273 domain-containing protein, partial [Lactococcus muris]